MVAASRNGSRVHLGAIAGVLTLALVALSSGPVVAPSGAVDTSTTSSTVPSGTTTTTAPPVTTTSSPTTTSTIGPPGSPLPWPKDGTAAVAIPQVSVIATSPRRAVRPIASLTKMMTAWVILSQLPLKVGQRGPCLTVNAHDVAFYDHDVATGESSAEVRAGERLCENTLLTGLLVHSAGNFAHIFLRLMGIGEAKMVARMNADAKTLGLTQTHYVDITGISPGNRSTAQDQVTLAADLMDAQPVVRSIVVHPSVTLPVAGVLVSYTPLVGTSGVVGVKSGFTLPAGGCDAMAVRVSVGGRSVTLYAVVLGQHGSDPLGLAGDEALALTRSLRRYLVLRPTSGGKVVFWVGSLGDVVTTTTTSTTTTSTTTSTTTTTSSTTTTVATTSTSAAP